MESSIQISTNQPCIDSVRAIRKSFELNQERAWASTEDQMPTLPCIRRKHKQFTTRQLCCLCLQALAFSFLVFDLLADSTPPLHQLRLDATQLLQASTACCLSRSLPRTNAFHVDQNPKEANRRKQSKKKSDVHSHCLSELSTRKPKTQPKHVRTQTKMSHHFAKAT